MGLQHAQLHSATPGAAPLARPRLIPAINNGTKDFVKFPGPRVPSSLQALFVKRGY